MPRDDDEKTGVVVGRANKGHHLPQEFTSPLRIHRPTISTHITNTVAAGRALNSILTKKSSTEHASREVKVVSNVHNPGTTRRIQMSHGCILWQ